MAMQGSGQQAASPFKLVTLTLVDSRREYGDVYTYSFTAEEPLPYNAGQYVHVKADLADPDAKGVRELSFSSAPHEDTVKFTIDGRSHSPFQQHMMALKPGQTVRLFKSKQHMLWPVIESCVVFIAGGVGITPFRSMVLDKVHSKVRMRVEVVHAAGAEHLFEEELRPLVDAYHSTNRDGLAAQLAATTSAQPGARYYIAGSPAFVETVLELLAQGGISQKKIHTDEFKGYTENWEGE